MSSIVFVGGKSSGGGPDERSTFVQRALKAAGGIYKPRSPKSNADANFYDNAMPPAIQSPRSALDVAKGTPVVENLVQSIEDELPEGATLGEADLAELHEAAKATMEHCADAYDRARAQVNAVPDLAAFAAHVRTDSVSEDARALAAWWVVSTPRVLRAFTPFELVHAADCADFAADEWTLECICAELASRLHVRAKHAEVIFLRNAQKDRNAEIYKAVGALRYIQECRKVRHLFLATEHALQAFASPNVQLKVEDMALVAFGKMRTLPWLTDEQRAHTWKGSNHGFIGVFHYSWRAKTLYVTSLATGDRAEVHDTYQGWDTEFHAQNDRLYGVPKKYETDAYGIYVKNLEREKRTDAYVNDIVMNTLDGVMNIPQSEYGEYDMFIRGDPVHNKRMIAFTCTDFESGTFKSGTWDEYPDAIAWGDDIVVPTGVKAPPPRDDAMDLDDMDDIVPAPTPTDVFVCGLGENGRKIMYCFVAYEESVDVYAGDAFEKVATLHLSDVTDVKSVDARVCLLTAGGKERRVWHAYAPGVGASETTTPVKNVPKGTFAMFCMQGGLVALTEATNPRFFAGITSGTLDASASAFVQGKSFDVNAPCGENDAKDAKIAFPLDEDIVVIFDTTGYATVVVTPDMDIALVNCMCKSTPSEAKLIVPTWALRL